MSNPSQPPRASDPRETDFLPGWSALVILLTVFALIGLLALSAIMRGGGAGHLDEQGGQRAFGPADFPEIDFELEPLPGLDAADSGRPGTFPVPPPPFSEDIFPCSECHAELEVNLERRELEYAHDEIALNHGPEERWCFDCHNPDDRDRLRLVNGTTIGFDQSYRLCGQCHGTIFRDWRNGVHGRRSGFWDGAKSYLLCAHCHDPHAPRFAPIEPLPPPVRPQFLAETPEEGAPS